MVTILRLNTIFTMKKDVHDSLLFEHDIHDGKRYSRWK